MAMERTGVIIDIPALYNIKLPIDIIGDLQRFGAEMFVNNVLGEDGNPRNRQHDLVRIMQYVSCLPKSKFLFGGSILYALILLLTPCRFSGFESSWLASTKVPTIWFEARMFCCSVHNFRRTTPWKRWSLKDTKVTQPPVRTLLILINFKLPNQITHMLIIRIIFRIPVRAPPAARKSQGRHCQHQRAPSHHHLHGRMRARRMPLTKPLVPPQRYPSSASRMFKISSLVCRLQAWTTPTRCHHHQEMKTRPSYLRQELLLPSKISIWVYMRWND